jgi:hypothetical protein
MNEDRIESEEPQPVAEPAPAPPQPDVPAETAEHPVPGVKHQPEPDAENIMPAEHEPGTL